MSIWRKTLKNPGFTGLLVIAAIAQTGISHAVPFNPDISISGSIEFDTASAFSAGTTQNGSITRTIGGTSTNSSILGTSVSGTNPLAGTLTDIGDGFATALSMQGDEIDDEGLLISNYSLDIANTSATEQYQVFLGIEISNLADADGVDAFVDSLFSFSNVTTASDFVFSDLSSDTFFGDFANGTSLGTFGALLVDNDTLILDFMLNPGAAINLAGEHELEGLVFEDVSSFNGQLSSSIEVLDVVNTTPPAVVPVPAAVWLFATALLGLAGFGKRRKAA